MTEIIKIGMDTDLSLLDKEDIENWLGKNIFSAPKDLWELVSTYLKVLGMEKDGLLVITSAIVNSLKWEM